MCGSSYVGNGLEIKCFIEDSRWYYAWVVLVPEECLWYWITNVYWKCN